MSEEVPEEVKSRLIIRYDDTVSPITSIMDSYSCTRHLYLSGYGDDALECVWYRPAFIHKKHSVIVQAEVTKFRLWTYKQNLPKVLSVVEAKARVHEIENLGNLDDLHQKVDEILALQLNLTPSTPSKL